MKRVWLGLMVAGILSVPVRASEDVKLPVNLDKLAERASESVDVTLDESMLQLASKFLSKDDPDEVQVKKLVGKLKGVYVRSFEFEKEGQYSMADVEAIRVQLKSPQWTRIVGVKSVKGDNSEIYIHRNGDQIGGLVVIATEPKELTIVHIDGQINPEELSELGGHMGIPEMGKSKSKAKGTGTSSDSKSKSSDKEEEEK
ncbi:MAG: DUF4252 domain-containing protein [Bryobacteraceae bacterium]